MKNIIFILLALAIAGCTPEAKQRRAEKKLSKLVKKNPGLVGSDTTWKDSSFYVPSIQDSASFKVKNDSGAVDSLTNKFEGKVKPDILDSLNKGFKDIMKKSGDIDTTIRQGKTKIRYKKKGDDIKINVEVEPDSVKAKIPVKVDTIKPVPALTWYEKFLMKIGKKVTGLSFSFLGLLLLYLLYRTIKKMLS